MEFFKVYELLWNTGNSYYQFVVIMNVLIKPLLAYYLTLCFLYIMKRKM